MSYDVLLAYFTVSGERCLTLAATCSVVVNNIVAGNRLALTARSTEDEPRQSPVASQSADTHYTLLIQKY